MRNYVSKFLAGTATANNSGAVKAPTALTEGQVIAFDFDTMQDLTATSVNIGFARGTAILGAPMIAGPIPKAKIKTANITEYAAPVSQEKTLTVSAVPTIGETVLVKVIYKDSLSILPNKTKQTIIAIQANSVNAATTTTWAAAIAAEFNKQEYKFVTITSATNVVTFVANVLTSESAYNGIDRPEVVLFDVGSPDEPEKGTYALAESVAPVYGHGTAAKMKWLEEQHMGRFGYSDRRSWNDNKKYQSQIVAGGKYNTLVVQADIQVEGDMQGTHNNPIGAMIAGVGEDLAAILTNLATAGVVPVTV